MVQLAAEAREAFAALYSQMAPRLYRTALGILGNPHDAADALQDAGLKAFRYFGNLQQTEAGPAWLTRILINACYDLGRRRSRILPSGFQPEADRPDHHETETDWELISLLQGLPEEQRATVVLRFFQDLTVPQIAALMNVPEGTVKSRLHTAMGRMRLALRAGEEGAQ